MSESCHRKLVMTHLWISISNVIDESWHIYEWLDSHRSHGTHMSESCHRIWVMTHFWIWICHVLDESWHTYEWLRSHKRSHGTRVNKSCQPTWVMSHVWTRHFKRVSHGAEDESWHTYEWVMSQRISVSMPHSYESWLIHTSHILAVFLSLFLRLRIIFLREK